MSYEISDYLHHDCLFTLAPDNVAVLCLLCKERRRVHKYIRSKRRRQDSGVGMNNLGFGDKNERGKMGAESDLAQNLVIALFYLSIFEIIWIDSLRDYSCQINSRSHMAIK